MGSKSDLIFHDRVFFNNVYTSLYLITSDMSLTLSFVLGGKPVSSQVVHTATAFLGFCGINMKRLQE